MIQCRFADRMRDPGHSADTDSAAREKNCCKASASLSSCAAVATGVTEYMNSGGTIEIAQKITGHTSPATTRIDDRSGDRLTLEEIERVQIEKKHEI